MFTEHPLPQRALTERLERSQVITLSEFQPADPASWERTSCRACLKTDLVEILNLGEQPPSNAFVTTGLMEWIDLGSKMLNVSLGCVHGSVLPIGNNFSVPFDEKFDSFVPTDGAI